MAVSHEADKHKCFATAVRKASRRLTKFYDDALTSSGLRSTQFSILAELARRSGPPPTLTELAEAMVSDRSSLGHALRPLIRDGYVALRQAKTDRRAQHIILTKRGRDKHDESATHWQAAQDTFVSLYGAAQAKTLRKTILEIAHDDRLSLRAVLADPSDGSGS